MNIYCTRFLKFFTAHPPEIKPASLVFLSIACSEKNPISLGMIRGKLLFGKTPVLTIMNMVTPEGRLEHNLDKHDSLQ